MKYNRTEAKIYIKQPSGVQQANPRSGPGTDLALHGEGRAPGTTNAKIQKRFDSEPKARNIWTTPEEKANGTINLHINTS